MQKLASVLFALCVAGNTAYASAQMRPVPPNPPNPPMMTPPAAATPAASPPAAPQPAASAAEQPSFDDVIASLSNMRAEIAKIQALHDLSANTIHPVNVTQLSGANSSALSDAITHNQTQVNALRTTLGKVTVTTPASEHITIAQFLADNKIDVSQIVAAHVTNGTLVLFYQK